MEGRKASAAACSVSCNHQILAARRKAAKWEGVDPDRPCLHCEKPLTGKRPHAQFCDRACKGKAAEKRLARPRVRPPRPRRPLTNDPAKKCRGCDASLEDRPRNATWCSRKCFSAMRYQREAERRKAYARQYLKDHPEEMRAIRRNRKSRVKAQRFAFNEKEWKRLVARYRGCCAYCGQKPDGPLHREHVIPIARGGRHSAGNILPACPPCNYSKHDKLLSEWRYRQRR